ncbi:MAG: DUF359 domain-containing protein [Candidatus Anstonellales archaeon]
MTKTRFRLTSKGRQWLSEPLGRAISEEELQTLKGRDIIAIGDISAYLLIKAGIAPKVAVFDFKSRRDEVEPKVAQLLRERYPNPILIENPPGSFSENFFLVARKAIAEQRGIFVKGEEDLLGIAFFIEAPEGWVVVYGQDRKFVVIEISPEFKAEVGRRLSEAFEPGL